MESIAGDLRQMQRTPLFDSHVDALRRIGEEVAFEAGHVMAKAGDKMDWFFYLEEGEIEIFDPITGERSVPFTLGPTQFMGEIAFLNGGAWTLPMRTAQPTKGIKVARDAMLRLMSEIPEMSDIVISVFAARRRRLVEESDSSLKLIGSDQSRDIRRIAAFAARNKIPFQSVEIGSHEAEEAAEKCSIHLDRPAVVFGDAKAIEDPTPAKVAKLLGLDLDLDVDEIVDVLIVGGGPAGVAAAVYAGAEGLKALVVEDITIGGQAGTSSRIENYMGFPTGISGADLVWRGEIQAMKFGTRFAMPRRVRSLEKLPAGHFCAQLDDGTEIGAKAIIVATGVQYRRLPLHRLEDFEGAGIYYAATDIEARYCRGSEVVVIGGGNSAGQAAMFLSRSAKHVHILVRGTSLAASMSDYLSSRIAADPAITVHYQSELCGLDGTDQLATATIRNSVRDEEWSIPCRAVFVMVGAAPNTAWLSGLVDLDERGFVKTGREGGGTSTYETSHPGIFAVGDVRAGSTKRVASAVGEGSVVISRVWDFVNTG
ncbi:FAD-dependent oxidoreductase [Actibacterium sp. 188UL27-1]|uniref:FAD-dependent oxidoreductase n=1 Tax=Actibacterium sp. 188UL27-1 TaxID=2786961 RepID=UPI00195EA0BB|nr:FAD-dependent oxidoreductase [Actibacterium sp. 188UL27-1]MBM7066563.1 FAD-dependent oxidoreductase [Actibacterium sp. 188UL27-1]